LRVQLARMELMARPDPKVRQAQQVQRERTALTARSDRRVQWDQQERTALTARLDRRVQWDQQVQRARMELTAR
jgi:hypothetical protein